MSRFRPRNQSYWLAHVCESNFAKLSQLIPDLLELDRDAVAFSSFGKPPLRLTLIERSRYTLTVDLSYCFDGSPQRTADPELRIRAYLDGKCAEAFPCPSELTRRRSSNLVWAQPAAILEEKWSLNYFLGRWLDHCLSSEYRFGPAPSTERTSVLA